MPKKTQGFLPSIPGGWYKSIGHGVGQNSGLHDLEKDTIRRMRGTCEPGPNGYGSDRCQAKRDNNVVAQVAEPVEMRESSKTRW